MIPHGESTVESEKKPNEVSRISTGQGNLVIQPQSGTRENSQNPRGERGSRLPINSRTKSGGHNSKASHETFEQRDEPSDFSDIRR